MPQPAAAIIGATIAGVVAVSAYLYNARQTRMLERRKAYAEALRCVEQYIQLPYSFHRRIDDDPATLKALSDLLSRTQIELSFHKQWLELESPSLGSAFTDWSKKAEERNAEYRAQALSTTPGSIEVPRDRYHVGSKEAKDECLREMRWHLTIRGQLGFRRNSDWRPRGGRIASS